MSRKQQSKQVRKSFSAKNQARRMTGHMKAWTWQAQAQIENAPHTRAKMKVMGSWIPVDQQTQALMYRQQADWIIGVRALCKAPDGVEYIESVTMTCRDFSLSDLSDPKLNAWLIQYLLEGVKTAHIVDVGWLTHTFRGASWEPDNERVGQWVCEGLGWLSIDSSLRRREWAEINADLDESMKELAA